MKTKTENANSNSHSKATIITSSHREILQAIQKSQISDQTFKTIQDSPTSQKELEFYQKLSAKSSLNGDQAFIGLNGYFNSYEIHLMDNFQLNDINPYLKKTKKLFKKDMKVVSVHTPLSEGNASHLEDILQPTVSSKLENTCYLAQLISAYQHTPINVIIHTQLNRTTLTNPNNTAFFLKLHQALLTIIKKYPTVNVCVENTVALQYLPSQLNPEEKILHFTNGFLTENVELVTTLRNIHKDYCRLSNIQEYELRLYTLIDTCHAIQGIRILNAMHNLDNTLPQHTLTDLFKANAPYLKAMHINNCCRLGLNPKDEHSVPFTPDKDDKELVEELVTCLTTYANDASWVIEVIEKSYDEPRHYAILTRDTLCEAYERLNNDGKLN